LNRSLSSFAGIDTGDRNDMPTSRKVQAIAWLFATVIVVLLASNLIVQLRILDNTSDLRGVFLANHRPPGPLRDIPVTVEGSVRIDNEPMAVYIVR
jgi:hypothetical protein